MQNKNVLGALLLAAALAGACKKDSDSSPGTSATSSCQVASQTDSASGKKESDYEFDANRRVVRSNNYKSGTLDSYTTYTYGSGTVTIQFFEGNGTKNGDPTTLQTNSQGFVSQIINVDHDTSSGVATTRRDTSTFTYNSDAQLASSSNKGTTLKDADNSFSSQSRRFQTNTYTNKRVTKSVVTYSNTYKEPSGTISSNSNTTTDFTYNESSPTVKGNPLAGSSFGLLGALGADKIPTKEVATTTSTSNPAGQTTTTTYTAVIENGLPTKIRMVRTESGSSSTDVSTTQYTYKCP